MGAPVVTLTPDHASYLPGAPVIVAVSVVDPDNSTERLVLVGQDSQGNQVTVTQDIQRNDPFTIDSARWERTGEALTVTGMAVSGPMPSA